MTISYFFFLSEKRIWYFAIACKSWWCLLHVCDIHMTYLQASCCCCCCCLREPITPMWHAGELLAEGERNLSRLWLFRLTWKTKTVISKLSCKFKAEICRPLGLQINFYLPMIKVNVGDYMAFFNERWFFKTEIFPLIG